jgi:hypothetical protein
MGGDKARLVSEAGGDFKVHISHLTSDPKTSNSRKRTALCRASIWDVMSLLTRRDCLVGTNFTANTPLELERTKYHKES